MSEAVRRVTLRHERDGPDRRYLSAYLDDDANLHIDGQDLGPKTAFASSDGEYEWFKTIRAADIPQLLVLLGATADDNVLDVLEEHWCGESAGRLEHLLRESGIELDLFVWSG